MDTQDTPNDALIDFLQVCVDLGGIITISTDGICEGITHTITEADIDWIAKATA